MIPIVGGNKANEMEKPSSSTGKKKMDEETGKIPKKNENDLSNKLDQGKIKIRDEKDLKEKPKLVSNENKNKIVIESVAGMDKKNKLKIDGKKGEGNK